MGVKDKIHFPVGEIAAQQSGAQECDINYIVERAKRGSDVSHLNTRTAQYGDFTEVPTDLRECLVKVRKADEAFMSLDAHVRKRFDNDPAKLLDFLNDSKNRDEAISLGLVTAPPAPVVDPVHEEIKGLRQDLKDSSGTKKSKSHRDDDE